MNFSSRSYQKELLDRTDLPFEAIEKNMQELDIINTYLGGHAITISGFKKLLNGKKEISICEIGCGGGDNLLAIRKWCDSKNITLQITGVDINPDCIRVAREKFPDLDAHLVTADFREVEFGNQMPDIIFASLFCHHFTHEELLTVFQWMDRNSGLGWFINDLHRHPIAYHAIRLLTSVFSRSYLVKNDAPLSVLRGFRRTELEKLLSASGFIGYSLVWKWAFRWLMIIKHDGNKIGSI
jgi:2-polyprenyl-3-methyl-5-hydroxy-6-metoxy-1,4-benzoquinol methylase